MPVHTKAEVPNLNSCSSSPLITGKGSQWIFRTQVISSRLMKGMMDFALDALAGKKIVVWNDTNEYGRAAAEGALNRFKQRGVTPVAHLTHQPKDKIFTPQLLKVKETGADIIAALLYHEEMTLILKQSKDLGIKYKVVTTDVMGTPVFFELAKELIEEYEIYASVLFSASDPDPRVQSFVKKIKDKFGLETGPLEAMGYDSVYILKDALERGQSLDKAKIRDAIRSSQYEGLCGKTKFDEKGDDMKAFLVTRLKGGKFIPIKRQE